MNVTFLAQAGVESDQAGSRAGSSQVTEEKGLDAPHREIIVSAEGFPNGW